MRHKKSYYALILAFIMSTAILGTMGIPSVSAGPPYGVPTVYVSWHPFIYTQLKPAVAAGSYVMAYVKVSGLPHETNEPILTTDKTWAAEISVSWDPDVLELNMLIEPPAWSPAAPTNPGAFWKWHYWWTDYMFWYSAGTYSAGYGKVIDNVAGTAKFGPTLSSPGPETSALPPEMDPGDIFYVPGCPDEGLHDGLYYDLPYSIDGKYENFAILRFLVKDPEGFARPTSRIHLYSPLFFEQDMKNTYHVTTVDGWYGEVGPHLHYVGSPIPDPSSPEGTSWHELYPTYCNYYDLGGWQDNGDGILSACDNITLTPTDPAGDPMMYHVEEVTTTITVSLKPDQVETKYLDLDLPADILPGEVYDPITEPVSTQWHELYPEYCTRYHLAEWEDTGEDGELNPSDQIYLVDKETGVGAWYHVDDVSTDIIVKPQPGVPVPEFPLGIGLLMTLALAIPIVYLWRNRKKVVR